MRLGELLVKEGRITRDQLVEALESQVVHGGRLGTNLLELGMLTEKQLAEALGRQHAMPAASGELHPDPNALLMVDAKFADDKDIVPMRVDSHRLSVAILNPKDVQGLDELARRTGRRVMPVVVPEVRMNYLLRHHYKAIRQLRAIDLDGRTVKPPPAEEPTRAAPAGPDLMSEEEFQAMYHQATGAAGSDVAPPPAPAPSPVPAQALNRGAPVAPPSEAPRRAPAPPAAPAAAPPAPPAAATAVPPAPTPPAAPPPAQAMAPPEPPPTPLGFAEAQRELQQISDREAVATAVLRFALGKFKRALLLSVQRNVVTGWRGMGVGVGDRAVKQIAVSLLGSNTFKLVRDTRSHFLGPMRADATTALFYKLLGGSKPPPTTALMLPLLARGKVVHILYVDDGPGQLTPPDVGELLILAQGVTRSYEELMRRRMGA